MSLYVLLEHTGDVVGGVSSGGEEEEADDDALCAGVDAAVDGALQGGRGELHVSGFYAEKATFWRHLCDELDDLFEHLVGGFAFAAVVDDDEAGVQVAFLRFGRLLLGDDDAELGSGGAGWGFGFRCFLGGLAGV